MTEVSIGSKTIIGNQHPTTQILPPNQQNAIMLTWKSNQQKYSDYKETFLVGFIPYIYYILYMYVIR